MHSILIAIPKPSPDIDEGIPLHAWQSLVSKLRASIGNDKTVEWLSESVLMVHVENGLNCFSVIVSACTKASTPYKVLFFEEKPAWAMSL